jgi:hypothetical protein
MPPIIDARSIFLRARERQRKAEEREAKRAERGATKKPRAKKKKAKTPTEKGEIKTPAGQTTCLRVGCTRPGPFAYGLCKHCQTECVLPSTRVNPDLDPVHETEDSAVCEADDRPQTEKAGNRSRPAPEDRLSPGDSVIVSGQYPHSKYRGLYAEVIEVEDDFAVASIRLLGTSDSFEASASTLLRSLAGKVLRLPTVWLLRVED